MYAKIFVALSAISFLCLENVQPASIGAIAQNIHSDLILLDANLDSSLRTNRDGRRINIDRFAVPSGKHCIHHIQNLIEALRLRNISITSISIKSIPFIKVY